MTILQYKVMSYRDNPTEHDIDAYCHGLYDTKDVADRVCADYNYIWKDLPLYAVVECNV